MAIEILQWDIGFLKAAADLSSKQHLFMKLSAADTANVAGAGEAIIGILQNKPAAAGRACEIRRLGVSKITAGDTVTVGAKLKSDSAGKGVAASTGDLYGGICLEAATTGKTTSILMEIGTM
jgi:hypothetical protein